MADKKISALTGATTPLAGTEVLPIVQSGATVKVSAADITAGRAISAASLSTGTTSVFAKVSTELSGGNAVITRFNSSNKPAGLYTSGGSGESFLGANLDWSSGSVFNYKLNGLMWYLGDSGGSGTTVGLGIASGTAGTSALVDTGANVKFKWDTSGDYTVVSGNVIIGTSGQGIDFSATPGTGTSELLADYEEGTWTPNQGGGLTVVGAFSSSGTYTRVGRLVTVTGNVTGATSIACTAGGIVSSNLPFNTNAKPFNGSLGVSNANQSASVVVYALDVYCGSAIAGTSTSIGFTVTYES